MGARSTGGCTLCGSRQYGIDLRRWNGARQWAQLPLILATIALFTEPPQHADYRGFTSRIRPLPLKEVDELLKETLISRDPVVPPRREPERYAPLVEFAPGDVTATDSSALPKLVDQLRNAPEEMSFLLIGTGDDENPEATSLGLLRAANVMNTLLDFLPSFSLERLLAGCMRVGGEDAPPPGTVLLQQWPRLNRDLVAADRRGRARSLEKVSMLTVNGVLGDVSPPGESELMVLRGGEDELGTLLLSAVELMQQQILPPERVAVGISRGELISLSAEPHVAPVWTMTNWHSTDDSLYAELRLDRATERQRGGRIVGLLRMEHGWMLSTGELQPTPENIKLHRSKLMMPEVGG